MKQQDFHGSKLLKAVICNITYYSSRTLDKLKVLFSDEDAFVVVNPSEINGRSNMELKDCSLAFKLEQNVLYQYARYGIMEEGAFVLECKEELTKAQIKELKNNIYQQLRTYEIFGSDADAIYEKLQLPVGNIDIDVNKNDVEATSKKIEEFLNEAAKYDSFKDYMEATKRK